MTESEWLTSTRLKSLTDYLLRERVVSQRKLRLYAIACCRRVEHLFGSPGLTHHELRKALDAAERFAEGAIKPRTLNVWRNRAWEALGADFQPTDSAANRAADAVVRVCQTTSAFLPAASSTVEALAFAADAVKDSPTWRAAYELARRTVFALLRDVVGNPFRPLPAFDPAWLTANGGLPGRIATGIYEERRFDELPILADVLDDAGCTANEIQKHLRGLGPHDRGCWALDVILNRT